MLNEQGRLPNNYMETLVFLEKREEPAGILYHPAEQRGFRFESLIELIKLCERLYNSADFPQQTHKLRDMRPGRGGEKTKDIEEMAMDNKDIPRGSEPTFIIKVQYRQNASWQGTIKWVEGNVERRFRSTLELIKLMDDAISDQDDTGWE